MRARTPLHAVAVTGARVGRPKREGRTILGNGNRRGRQERALSFAMVPLLILFAAACQGPSFIDKECIKGRLSAEQAEEINKGPWGHLPTYNRDPDGHCEDCAAAEDRIFAAKCSEFLKKITLHD